MAELSAIASIVGIVGAGAQLSIALFNLAEVVGSAGSEIRLLGTEISLFCSVLKQLEKTLTKARSCRYSMSAIETTQEILDRCRDVFKSIETAIDGLSKPKGQSLEPSVDLLARMKWAFARSKVQMQRATLESCKITLHLMLATLEFARKLSHRRVSTSETQIEDDREQNMTQSLIIAQQCAVDRLKILEDEACEENSTSNQDSTNLTTSSQPSSAGENGPGSHIQVNRRSQVVNGLFVRPLQSNIAEAQRRTDSRWLNDLIFNHGLMPSPRRQTWGCGSPSVSKAEQLAHLLRKWTDQGERWLNMPGSHSDAFPGTFPGTFQGISPQSVSSPEGRLSPITRHTSDRHLYSFDMYTSPNEDIVLGIPEGGTTLNSPTEETAPTGSGGDAAPPPYPSPNSPLPPAPPAAQLLTPAYIVPFNSSHIMVGISKIAWIGLHEPSHTVTRAFFETFDRDADWQDYDIHIMAAGGGDRCVGGGEKPLLLYRQLWHERKQPLLVFRKRHPTPLTT